ncbi:MAG TPA: cohesin domain-containing protein, partial [Defluviitaleaceae bacterium]|nr:cohesin domain-containing protein [Defluviitaleaceae bacterium]
MKRAISLFLVFSILFVSAFTYNIPVFAAENKGSITLSLDSNRIKEVGEIITATVEIKDVPNFAGCQFNIKYDPTVLQPVKSNGVPYTNSTPAEGGTILNNSNYGFLTIGHHDLQKGELNFSKSYLSFNSYKASGKAEESGILAVIRFKVLKNEATSIKFADTKFMPGANSGVYLFNWDGNQIKDFTVNQPEDLLGPSSVFISLDSDKITQVGQIIKATVNVDNMDNLAGYQFNIKYDPEVLQPVRSNGVPYESGTIADKGELLSNPEFGEFSIGDNDLKSGIINQGKAYLNLNEYKNSGNPESTGSIAIIYFKVLKVKDTTISFAPHRAMPEAIEGTMLFDWNGDKISNYSVLKEAKLTAEEIVELPEIKSVTADKSSPQYEDTSITWTCDATGKDLQYAWTIKKDGNVVENKDFSANNTFTYIAETAGTYIVTVTVRDAYNNMVSKESEAFVIIEKEIEIPGHVSLSVDKNKITKVGEIITATVNVKDMQNLAGFQVNIKYDPTILQPVKADGSPYKRSTFPEDGTLINNNEYLPIRAAGNDVDAGIVNFGKSYAYMNDYRENGVGESTGSLGVIYFKVLAVKPTTLSFEDTATMPGAIDGTMMFDWNANKKNNYTVEKSVSIDAEEEIEIPGHVSLSVDKNKITKVGEIITATVNVKDMQNLAGFQVNIKYDPTILQPVKADGSPYKRSTFPEDGTLINNNEYLPIRAAGNDVDAGIVNFGKSYAYMNDYRENGVGESTGSLGVIYFKVLAVKPTTLSFEDTATMPGAIDGTMMFDWNANKKNNYTVEKSVSIDAEEEIIELPEIKNVTADKSSPQLLGTSITWTCDATGKNLQYAWTVKKDSQDIERTGFSSSNTFSFTPEEAGTYVVTVTVKDKYNHQVSKEAASFVIQANENPVKDKGEISIVLDKNT